MPTVKPVIDVQNVCRRMGKIHTPAWDRLNISIKKDAPGTKCPAEREGYGWWRGAWTRGKRYAPPEGEMRQTGREERVHMNDGRKRALAREDETGAEAQRQKDRAQEVAINTGGIKYGGKITCCGTHKGKEDAGRG
jgi:hypothetical protein